MFDKEYWLVFKHSEHWSQFFLKKGFGHCYIVMKDKFEWYVLDPKSYGINVQILGYSLKDDVPRILKKQGHKVIKIITKNTDKQYFKLPRFVTCITLVKYFMGIKIFSLTPYQLFKKLRYRDNSVSIIKSRELV